MIKKIIHINMKTLNIYISEKLVLNKNTFKKPDYKYFPETKKELKDIISTLLNERGPTADLNDIDTSKVKDMSNLFYRNQNITMIDISYWDVSNVENIAEMFAGCSSLKNIGDLSGWDVSNVTNMNSMFFGCKNLKQVDLSRWNTIKVDNIRYMFFHCKNLKSTGDLSGWDVRRLRHAKFMFDGCENLTFVGDLSHWNINEKLFSKEGYFLMFNGCSKLYNIPKWYTD